MKNGTVEAKLAWVNDGSSFLYIAFTNGFRSLDRYEKGFKELCTTEIETLSLTCSDLHYHTIRILIPIVPVNPSNPLAFYGYFAR